MNSNDTANKYLFFGIAIYLLLMNIWAFALFGADKSNAKRKQRRIKESKLMKVCFFRRCDRRYYRYECVPSQDAEKEIFGRYTDFVRITAYFKQFHTRNFWDFGRFSKRTGIFKESVI